MSAIASTAERRRRTALGLLVVLALVLAAGPVRGAERIVVHALFKDRAVVSVDGQRQLLRAGERTAGGVLLVRSDSEGALIEVDGERRTYALGTAVAGSYAPPRASVVQIWPDGAGMYMTVGSINGLPVRFLVDTGASAVAMNSSEARRLGIDYLLTGRPSRVSTASGVVPAFGVTLDRVQVGDVRLRNVAALVIEGEHPEQVLLGMSFLGRLKIERSGGAMVLRQTH